MPRDGADVALERSRLDDLGDLADRVAQLLVGVEVVRPEPDARVGAEVAEDLPLHQLTVDRRELRHVDGHGAAAAARVAGAANTEPGGVCEVDQKLCLAERVLADPVDADLLDQVVPGRCGVVRRDVRRAGQEPYGPAA